ncbi:MAG: RimK family alpha-L-glutamate ligase [Rikenellaceae bacterium]
MRLLFLYPRSTANKANTAFDWLRETAKDFGIELRIAFFEEVTLLYPSYSDSIMIGGEPYPLPDVALLRGYDLNLGQHLERKGVRVVNPSISMEYARNKLLTHQILSSKGIPSIRTLYSHSYDFDMVAAALELPFVAKSLVGSCGDGVYLVDSRESFERVVEQHKDVLVQSFISNSTGRDIRVWVIGDRVAGAVLRYNSDSFLSNYAQGGSAMAINLPPEVEELALRSTRALGLDFAGVDILFDKGDRYVVCEVNANAGFRTHSIVSHDPQLSIPHQLFEYISQLG